MGKSEKKNKSTSFYVILVIVIIAILCVALYFVVNTDAIFKSAIEKEVITAENQEEIVDKVEEEFGSDDDRVYYLAYSMMYYMFRDGLSSAFSNNTDENAMYENIYGKTVGQLIDEGKQLMEENNITVEEYKESIKDLAV